MLNRWIEPEVIEACDELGLGIIAFSPLGQGMLTDRYLNGIPEDSRAAKDGFLRRDFINDDNMARIRGLNDIASRRGQTLAAMAISWVLRDPRVTSALIGASSVAQLDANLAAVGKLDFTAEELAEIDTYAVESGINIWQQSSDA
jgi:L-glyceraldehyde 3-phosphate reductase